MRWIEQVDWTEAEILQQARIMALETALRDAQGWLVGGKPEPYEDHICGPDSACDMHCVAVVEYSKHAQQVRNLLGEQPR